MFSAKQIRLFKSSLNKLRPVATGLRRAATHPELLSMTTAGAALGGVVGTYMRRYVGRSTSGIPLVHPLSKRIRMVGLPSTRRVRQR